MEPMPETRETLRRLSVDSDVDLEATLARQAERVLEIVPDCVGISISYLQEGLTFTLVATPEADRRPGRDPVPPWRALRRGGEVRQADGRARRRPAG